MFRVSKLTDYGTVLMTALAVDPQALHSAQDLAERSRLGPATVAKLLKQLAQSGLVVSQRGAHGGYRLARRPDSITVADIVCALEGPLAVTECATHGSRCGIEAFCTTRTNWRLINTAVRKALESVTLADMAAPLTLRLIGPAALATQGPASRPTPV